MQRSSLLVAGLVAAVAAAAAGSAVRGHDEPGAPTTRPTAATVAAVSTAAAEEPPPGDVERLPPPRPGDLRGALTAYAAGSCAPVVLDLGRLVATTVPGMQRACRLWPSPSGQMLALTAPAAQRVLTARAIDGAAEVTDESAFLPLQPAVTISDDGTVAFCTGTEVLRTLGRHDFHAARSFRHDGPGTDERCVTGAVGRRIVQLAADRRRLVELGGDRTLRRLARAVPRPLLAIATAPDGLVAMVDGAGGRHATVFRPDGSVAVPRRSLQGGHRGPPVKVLLARGGGALALATADGWSVTSLREDRSLASPGGELVYDVAFSPDGTMVAMATPPGIVVADVHDLTPRWLLHVAAQGVEWFDERLFPTTPTTPL